MTFQADDARLAAMHGYAPVLTRERAMREVWRRVLIDRILTRCEVESRRVLNAYEWPSYG